MKIKFFNFILRRAANGDSGDAWNEHLTLMKEHWAKVSTRFEAILKRNGGLYLVGESMTYADILVAHLLTWFVEEVSLRRNKNVLLLLIVFVNKSE